MAVPEWHTLRASWHTWMAAAQRTQDKQAIQVAAVHADSGSLNCIKINGSLLSRSLVDEGEHFEVGRTIDACCTAVPFMFWICASPSPS